MFYFFAGASMRNLIRELLHMRVLNISVLVLCTGLLVSVAWGTERGRPDANSLVRLSDYLKYAALHNAGLKADFERWRAAVEQVPQAGALPDPRLSYGYYVESVKTRVGPQEHRFGLMQMFPWFGTIEARTDAAAAAAKAAARRYESARLKLFYEVKSGFYEYSYLARAVEIAKENLELLKHFEEVARTRYEASKAGHPDIIRAQVELAKLEDVVVGLQELRKPVVARLNAALNRRVDADLRWPVREEYRGPARLERREVIAQVATNNPELQALAFEVDRAGSEVALAEKKFWPEVGLGVDWIETGSAGSAVRDSGRDAVIAMFSLTLPVWRDSYAAGELQAKARQRAARQSRMQTENDMTARSERVLYDFEDSGRKVRLYRDTLIPKARQLLSASETAYRAGGIDFLSLIDAQRTLLEYELLYEQAVKENLQRLAELEMLMGTETSQSSGKTTK